MAVKRPSLRRRCSLVGRSDRQLNDVRGMAGRVHEAHQVIPGNVGRRGIDQRVGIYSVEFHQVCIDDDGDKVLSIIDHCERCNRSRGDAKSLG